MDLGSGAADGEPGLSIQSLDLHVDGVLAYALAARNFNPVVAMAADTVMVDADNIGPVGVIAPDRVVTPAPVVDYLIARS